MIRRLLLRYGLTIIVAVLSAAVVSVAGQGRKVPRTPWGDPDLQGVWPARNSAELTFQRLTNFDVATVLRELIEAGVLERIRTDTTGEPAWARAEVATWLQKHTGTTALVIDPPDGRVPPLTPAGLARAEPRWRTSWGPGPWNSAEDLGPYDRCISRGLPGSMLPSADTNGIEIVQAPGIVAIRNEMIHETRVIPLDGRPHVSPKIRGYMGDSRGSWKGDTLVVETTNFNGRIGARMNGDEAPTSDRLRVLERFTPSDAYTIQYELTIDDPDTWTRPWTVAYVWQRTSAYASSLNTPATKATTGSPTFSARRGRQKAPTDDAHPSIAPQSCPRGVRPPGRDLQKVVARPRAGRGARRACGDARRRQRARRHDAGSRPPGSAHQTGWRRSD